MLSLTMETVQIYSTNNCKYCVLAKDFFKEHRIDFTEFNVSEDPEKRAEMVEMTGQLRVPVMVIDGEIMVGFEENKIKLEEKLTKTLNWN